MSSVKYDTQNAQNTPAAGFGSDDSFDFADNEISLIEQHTQHAQNNSKDKHDTQDLYGLIHSTKDDVSAGAPKANVVCSQTSDYDNHYDTFDYEPDDMFTEDCAYETLGHPEGDDALMELGTMSGEGNLIQ